MSPKPSILGPQSYGIPLLNYASMKNASTAVEILDDDSLAIIEEPGP
jgi:hypothetical protein